MSTAESYLAADPRTTGVVVVDHGSRREESNRLLLEVAQAFRQASQWEIVEPAHMELAEPSIAAAFDRCVARGAKLVIVFPYFLSPGRHWSEDIPRLAAAAAASHAGVAHLVAAPLGLHPLMLEVIGQRIEHCLERIAGRADDCELCDGASGCSIASTPQ